MALRITRGFCSGWKRRKYLYALTALPTCSQATGNYCRLLYTSKSDSANDKVDTSTERQFDKSPQKKANNENENLHKASPTQKLNNLADLLKNIQKPALSDSDPLVQRTTPMTVEEVVEFLRSENAEDICVINIPPEKDYVEYFITCTGMGIRHVGRLADNLVAEVKRVQWDNGKRRVYVEGRDSDDWMAVDMGTIVVHVMTEEGRRLYQLEKLWTLGIEYDDQCRSMLDMFDSMTERKLFQ